MPDLEDRWYFTKERLQETPSRRHGYDYDKELSCRQQAANFIQDMGQKLCVSQLCINTAIVYMHRFYVFHSLSQFHRNAIATAALFLAAKVEEQPRKVEHVLKVAHLCLHRDNPSTLDPKSDMYQDQSNDLVMNESILLQTLGFDVGIDHPHTHVVRCCQLVKASKDLAQTSYFMASNSLHLTTMCLQYKPTVVACFCIHLACKWSNWEIPRSSEGKDWFWYVNQSVTLDLLEQLTSEFLFIFEKCPTKLKKKMMSMNQSNPPANLVPAVSSGSQNETYVFAEPRKLTGAEANRPPDAFLQMKAAEKSAAASAAPPSQPQQQQHPPRHIDYKDYKEKKDRERAQRDKAQRDALTGGNPPRDVNLGGHLIGKHMDKAPQQQRVPSSSAVHKGYPQQQRPTHPGHPGAPLQKDAPIHHNMKEAVKRKREDGGDGAPDPKKLQSKPTSQHPLMPSSKLPPAEAQTASGIREIITQSFPHPRDKQERPGYQGFPPQQRQHTDKYGRPQVPPNKESSKRMEEFIHKPVKGEEDPIGPNYLTSAKAMIQKPRDPKLKGQVHGKQSGVPGHPSSLELAANQRKAMERAADKSRKHPEAGRGLQSYMGSLLAGDGLQKPSDQKIMGFGVDPIKKERVSPASKPVPNVPKVKPGHKQQDSLPEGYFDLFEPIDQELSHEGPQRSQDKKIMGYTVESRKERVSPTLKPVPKAKPNFKPDSMPEGMFDIGEHYESEPSNQGHSKITEQKRMPHNTDPNRKDRPSSHPKPISSISKPKPNYNKPPDSLPDEIFDPMEILNEPQVVHQEQLLHYAAAPKPQDSKPAARVKPGYKTQEVVGGSLFDIPYSVDSSLSSMGHSLKHSESKKMPFGSDTLKKDHVLSTSKSVPTFKQESLPEGMFEITGYDTELPDFFDSLEPSPKVVKKDHLHEAKPHGLFSSDNSTKIAKPSSIFSPDINAAPKSIFSTEKEKKMDLTLAPQLKKPSSSLFSPPPVLKTSSHRSSSSSDRELVLPSGKTLKTEGEDIVFPAFDDSLLEQKPFKEAKVAPPLISSPISTVNLVGMELMVDTSRPISTEKAAIIKPTPTSRSLPEPVQMKPSSKEPEIPTVEIPVLPKFVPPTDDSESARKNKKKKEKDSHRHKEKKKKDSDRKEKKKHRDKDKERKKDSHRDKDKPREKDKQMPPAVVQEAHLKITIPKDKISLDNPGSGLKIKIARDRLKPEDIEGTKPTSSEGSLKIKIKKDVITNYKDEGSEKKKESSSHSSSHKSSKSGDKKKSSHSSSHSNRSN